MEQISNLKKVNPITIKQQIPKYNDICNALDVLRDQKLAIYQELYEYGFTQPGTNGGEFRLERSVNSGFTTVFINIIPNNLNYVSYTFSTKDTEGLLEKILLIKESINDNRSKVHSLACCPLAKIRSCGCAVSFDCPLHGAQCHGSHD